MHRSVDIDSVDAKLLAALQADGSMTNQQLADRVGLSSSQCSRRRQRLEDLGIICRYRAVLDHRSLGYAITVFITVILATHSPQNATRFHALVSKTAEILEAHSLTGDADYLLKAAVPDLHALSRLINDVLLPHESVERVRSRIVLDTIKEDGLLPIH